MFQVISEKIQKDRKVQTICNGKVHLSIEMSSTYAGTRLLCQCEGGHDSMNGERVLSFSTATTWLERVRKAG